MSIYAKGDRGKADRLFSLIIRSKGFCQCCGATSNLQCAHIISRKYSNTRTLEKNAFCLCAGCHMHFTHWPLEFSAFVEEKIGKYQYQALREIAHRTTKVNWPAEVARLKDVWASISADT